MVHGADCCLRRWNGFFGRCDPQLKEAFMKSKHWDTFLKDNPGRTTIGTTKFLGALCRCCHSGDHRACADTVIVELEVSPNVNDCLRLNLTFNLTHDTNSNV